jgi:hypothetical protein
MAVLAHHPVELAAAHRPYLALALLIISAAVLVGIGIWLWQVNKQRNVRR